MLVIRHEILFYVEVGSSVFPPELATNLFQKRVLSEMP